MAKLMVLVASTRPGRVGSSVGAWIDEVAKEHGAFDVELVELADMNLPLFDEPQHPAMRSYLHEHTKSWSAKVEAADAFIFVTPEYNFSTPASLLNALTYLVQEWHYKPVGFASYGGISGGIRSVQMTKQVLTTFKMVPLYEAVVIPHVQSFLDDQNQFQADQVHTDAANTMLTELKRWSGALTTLRTKETK